MFEVAYWDLFIFITVLFLVFSVIEAIRCKKAFASRALKIILFYTCIVVISRIVYFPWHHVNGQIANLKFDKAKILPFWLNLVPIVHLFDIYDGWQMNIIGNITMFIPVGIIWPVCFKKLNTLGKVILAGGGYSLLIEVSQLFFYERSSDIDDLLLNTTGVVIGALIYFGVKKLKAKKVTHQAA